MLVLWDIAAVVFTMQTCRGKQSTAQKKTFLLHHYIIILTSVEKRDRQKAWEKGLFPLQFQAPFHS